MMEIFIFPLLIGFKKITDELLKNKKIDLSFRTK